MTTYTDDLTPAEREVSHLVAELVTDEGMSITEASEHALAAVPHPRPEFVLWVSNGTLARVGDTNYRIDELDTRH